MRFVLAKELKRKREGKDTEFEISGRPVPHQKRQWFMQRKALSKEDIVQSDACLFTSSSSFIPLLTATSDSSVYYILYAKSG
jgi:hypothetical protein